MYIKGWSMSLLNNFNCQFLPVLFMVGNFILLGFIENTGKFIKLSNYFQSKKNTYDENYSERHGQEYQPLRVGF